MILGITGISGTGKHTAAQFLHQKKWVILDADKIAHYLYRPYTSVWKAIVERFGEGILNTDDHINRQKLGKIVFDQAHPEALRDLNVITHPAVVRHLKEELHHLHRGKQNIAIIAALWKEIELPEICDKILLIKSDSKSALDRIKKRDSLSEKEYQARIIGQSVPPNPDFTVENSGSFRDFYEALSALALS